MSNKYMDAIIIIIIINFYICPTDILYNLSEVILHACTNKM